MIRTMILSACFLGAALAGAAEMPRAAFRPEGLKCDGLLVRSARDDQRTRVEGPDDFHAVLVLPTGAAPEGDPAKWGHRLRAAGITAVAVAAGKGPERWLAAGFDKLVLLRPVEGLHLDPAAAAGSRTELARHEAAYCKARRAFTRAERAFLSAPDRTDALKASMEKAREELVKAEEVFARAKSELLARRPSLSDPAWLERAGRQLEAAAKALGEHLLLVDLGAGAAYTPGADPAELGHGPHGLRSLREWLKSSYGSLEALNVEWDSAFKGWEGVSPLTVGAVRAEYEARKFRPPAVLWWKTPNLVSWSDWRTFNDLAFSQALAGLRARLPGGAPLGFSGPAAPWAWGGYDLWRLAQAVSFLAPGDAGGAHAAARSFNRRRFPIYAAVSGKPDARALWPRVLAGDRGVMVTAAEVPGTELGRELTPFRGGLVKLLSALEPERPPIAIHYSQRSIQADWMFEGLIPGRLREGKRRREFKLVPWADRATGRERAENRMLKSRGSLLRLLGDLGCSFEFVSSEEVASGELRKRGYKLLFLPRSMAVSAEEAAAIARFVEAGGTAVADLFPGKMDGHCRILPRGTLDELFGIMQITFRFPERDAELVLDGRKVPGLLDRSFAVDESAEVHAYVAGRPALVARSTGKGRTWFLAFDFFRYEELCAGGKAAGAAAAVRGFFRKIVDESGAASAWPAGREVPGVRLARWRGEDLALVGLSADAKAAPPAALTVRLPGAGPVYDLVTGKHYGRVEAAEVSLGRSGAAVLVRVPGEIRGLEGRLAGDRVVLKVAADGPPPRLTVLHLEVLDASGAVIHKNCANYLVRGGAFEGRIDRSKAAVAGRLKLRFTELLSGKSWETEIAGE